MIHILLMILKIIGIILLVILGILLLIILAVLFAPVRYKAEFSWHGEPDLALKASWFLHLLSFRALYTKEGLKFVVRVLGFSLLGKHDKDALKDAADAVKDGTEDVLDQEGQTLYHELEEDEARYRKSAEERSSLGRHAKAEAEGAEAGKDTPPASGDPQSLPGRIRSRAKALWEKLKFSFIRIRDKLKGMQALHRIKRRGWRMGRTRPALSCSTGR